MKSPRVLLCWKRTKEVTHLRGEGPRRAALDAASTARARSRVHEGTAKSAPPRGSVRSSTTHIGPWGGDARRRQCETAVCACPVERSVPSPSFQLELSTSDLIPRITQGARAAHGCSRDTRSYGSVRVLRWISCHVPMYFKKALCL